MNIFVLFRKRGTSLGSAKILVVIFWNFKDFEHGLDLPRVKQNSMYSKKAFK